jgi:serine phosphatase RsbU (regulator of sigma subunit)
VEQVNLIDKLSFQVEAFQKGFLTLSKALTVKDMMKNFDILMRGAFPLKDFYLFHKTAPSSEWVNFSQSEIPEKSLLSFLEESEYLKIKYLQQMSIIAAVNLPLGDDSYFGMLLGEKSDGTPFSDYEKISLHILLQVLDSAHKTFLNNKKEKKLIFDLNEKVFQLNNLIDTGIELSRFEKHDVLYELALERAATITNASSALIRIVSENNSSDPVDFTFPYGSDPDNILNSVYTIESSFSFSGKKYLFYLSEKETRGGVTSFNDLDKLLLESITRQVAAAIENEFLLKQSLEKERIEQELNVAASIQQQIIPKELPKIAGYDLAGINIPSKEVGGDYFDCISLGSNKTALIIADVAGKGISAALLVNTLSAALYSYIEFNLPLSDLSDRLNKLIYKASPSDKYITFFIAVLDHESGEMDMLNAGHNPILLLRSSGEVYKINAGGVGLGMFDFGIPFTGEKTIMHPGDKLFLYTDGIPEAMNESEEEYSDEKMIEFFVNNSDKTSEEFIQLLVKDVKQHAGFSQQSDDITVLLLKRNLV